MSGASWLEWRQPEGAHGARSLENRSALAFLVIALLNVPGIIVSPWGGPPSLLLNATAVLASIGTTILYVLVARGIERRRRWAMLAMRPLLVVVVVFGSYAVVVATQQGFIKVPVDVVLAIWAWFGRPDRRPPADPSTEPEHRPAARAMAVVGTVILLQAVIWYGPPVFGWGGLLDARQADFAATLTVDCAPGSGGPPATLSIAYDWTWRVRAPVPSGLDVVVIGWQGVDGQGRILYLLGDTPDSGPGIEQGKQDFPSRDMATAIESQIPGSWHWGIQLGQQGMAPGHIAFTLERAHDSPPQPGPLTITASYIHLGIWHTDMAPVTCTW